MTPAAPTALTPTWSATPSQPATSSAVNGGSMNGDVDPYYDTCSDTNHTTTGALGVMSGQNIGDLLNASHVTLGLVPGRLRADLDQRQRRGLRCDLTPTSPGVSDADYSPHHNPFQYYASTANPDHLAPTSLDGDRLHRPGQPPVRPVATSATR